jgi:nucleoporin NUP82
VQGLSSLFERTLRLSSTRNTPTQQNGYLVADDGFARPLLVLETISLQLDDKQPLEPLFTPDTRSKQGVFVTHCGGIFYLSISSWANQLLGELGAAQEEGSEFRLGIFLESAKSLVQTILKFPEQQEQSVYSPSCCIVLEDSDLGYFLLASANGQPFAATLDAPDSELTPDIKLLESGVLDKLSISEPRLPYQPPPIFWQESSLINYYKDEVPARQKRAFAEEIKLSPAALDILTRAHRILSHETHQLGVAAADLFRRCERLQVEFREQLQRASELANRIDNVTGDVEEEFGEDEENVVGNERIEKRLEEAKTRQDSLVAKYEAIKMRLARAGGQQLSKNEKAWVEEVKHLNGKVNKPSTDAMPADEDETILWHRLEQVKRLKEELTAQAEHVQSDEIAAAKAETVTVSSEVKRQKTAKVMELLERETALVNATQQRLNSLRLSTQAL